VKTPKEEDIKRRIIVDKMMLSIEIGFIF